MSTMTDARVHSNYVIQTGEVPVRHTHEEYMDVSAPPYSSRLDMPVAMVPQYIQLVGKSAVKARTCHV